jgi:geranylgeranyl transferase type-2 subunit alpha
MHGRERRPRGEPTREEAIKVEKYTKAKNDVMRARQAKVYTKETYELTAAIMVVNPDFYTVYNFRKEILLNMLSADAASAPALYAAELSLMEKSLQKNHKSYCAWAHRLWVCERGGADLRGELTLCDKFLSIDERNFHCWNYRRSVAQLACAQGIITPEHEFEFTGAKIEHNFSNYSAWHYRSVLLPLVISRRVAALAPELALLAPAAAETRVRAVVDEAFAAETERVTTAFAMEPEDQSSWLYFRWLIGQMLGLGNGYLFHPSLATAAAPAAATAADAAPPAAVGVDGSSSFESFADRRLKAAAATLMPFLPSSRIAASSFSFLLDDTSTASSSSSASGSSGATDAAALSPALQARLLTVAAPIERALTERYAAISALAAAAVTATADAKAGAGADAAPEAAAAEAEAEAPEAAAAAAAPAASVAAAAAPKPFKSLYFVSSGDDGFNSPSSTASASLDVTGVDADAIAALLTVDARAALLGSKFARLQEMVELVVSLLGIVGGESKWVPGMLATLLVALEFLSEQARALGLLAAAPGAAEALAAAAAAMPDVLAQLGAEDAAAGAAAEAEEDERVQQERRRGAVRAVLRKLGGIDPLRSGYYKDVSASLDF